MTDFEKAVRAAEIEMQKVEMIDAAPSVIRALQAKRVALAVLRAVREPGVEAHNAGAFSDGQAKEPTLQVGPNGVVMIDWQCAHPSKMFGAMIDAILADGEGR